MESITICSCHTNNISLNRQPVCCLLHALWLYQSFLATTHLCSSVRHRQLFIHVGWQCKGSVHGSTSPWSTFLAGCDSFAIMSYQETMDPEQSFQVHSTGRAILYLQPINKLTSQCEIRTLWPGPTTNNRVLSFDMSAGCIDRRKQKKTPPHLSHPSKHTISFQGIWGGGTNTFRPWSNEILAVYLHSLGL